MKIYTNKITYLPGLQRIYITGAAYQPTLQHQRDIHRKVAQLQEFENNEKATRRCLVSMGCLSPWSQKSTVHTLVD